MMEGKAPPQQDEMVDFTNFNASDTSSKRKASAAFDAFDAPPPTAAAMNFDDDEAEADTSAVVEEEEPAQPVSEEVTWLSLCGLFLTPIEDAIAMEGTKDSRRN